MDETVCESTIPNIKWIVNMTAVTALFAVALCIVMSIVVRINFKRYRKEKLLKRRRQSDANGITEVMHTVQPPPPADDDEFPHGIDEEPTYKKAVPLRPVHSKGIYVEPKKLKIREPVYGNSN
jgi:hypothetical protein